MRPILTFVNEFEFLSNFYNSPFVWNRFCWPTVEHAYQAAKCLSPENRGTIRSATTPNIDRLSKLRGIVVKEENEEMHPMGRNFKGVVNCTEKCMKHKQPVRLGLFPTGDILLQNCDRAYPVVSHISEGFTVAFDNVVRVRKNGRLECKQLFNINDVLKELNKT